MAPARRDGGRMGRISFDKENQTRNPGPRRLAQFAHSSIDILGVTAGRARPHDGGGAAMVLIFLVRQLYRRESLGTFLDDDNLEPSTARATSNKCEVGMARKCVSVYLRSARQQKPDVVHKQM